MKRMDLRLMQKVCCVALVVAWVINLGAPAQAKILLKPNGKNAAPLRTKAVQAEVVVQKQFAHTRQVLTFQNEASDRIEADFVFTTPPHSVVTYFAYWYGKEKVVARVVEKDRATQIYSYITSRMKDLALIELIGKDTFRARIFPVEPNADLKVEIQTVQTLPSNKTGAVYDYPLREMRGSAVKLESLDLKVRVQPDAEITGVANNYGAKVESRKGVYSFSIKGTNYRPSQDFQVQLNRPSQPLQASFYAARSGGPTGFFALALTPNKDLKNPRLKLSGVQLLDKLPAKLPPIKANQVYTLVGRYRGSGAARLTVTDGAWREKKVLRFTNARENNNLATRLWASRRIAALSASKSTSSRRQKRVIALSKQYTLPSKFTSWLAIPDEERKNYKNEKEAAERSVKINATARRLAVEIAQGRGRSRAARRLKLQFARLDRADSLDAPKELLDIQLSVIADELAHAIVTEKYSAIPNARRIASLKSQLNRVVRKQSGYDSTKSLLANAESQLKSEKVSALTQQWLSEKYSVTPDSKRLRILKAKVAKLKITNVDTFDDTAKIEWARDEMNLTLAELVSELDKDEPNIARVKNLGAKHRKIFQDAFKWEGENVSTQVQDDLKALEELQSKRAQAAPQSRTILDEARFTKLEEMSRRQMEFGYGGGGGGDPLISVEAPEDAAQVVAVMPDGVNKKLLFNVDTKRWEAHFDIPEGSSEGTWIIRVIIVDNAGVRRTLALRFGIDATPPRGQGKARLARGGSTPALRLELDAGEDASRVIALTPWGEKIELAPSTENAQRFFALVAAPKEYSQSGASQVEFIITDRAHNRTSIMVDVSG